MRCQPLVTILGLFLRHHQRAMTGTCPPALTFVQAGKPRRQEVTLPRHGGLLVLRSVVVAHRLANCSSRSVRTMLHVAHDFWTDAAHIRAALVSWHPV